MILHRAPQLTRLAVLACALIVSACQAQSPAQSSEEALLARIRSEIGEAGCNSDTQCRTLAIGHKACGGPQQWWAWSTTSAQAEPLQAWAAELAEQVRKRQEASGMVSNCQYLPDPGAVCVAQRCVLRTPSSAR